MARQKRQRTKKSSETSGRASVPLNKSQPLIETPSVIPFPSQDKSELERTLDATPRRGFASPFQIDDPIVAKRINSIVTPFVAVRQMNDPEPLQAKRYIDRKPIFVQNRVGYKPPELKIIDDEPVEDVLLTEETKPFVPRIFPSDYDDPNVTYERPKNPVVRNKPVTDWKDNPSLDKDAQADLVTRIKSGERSKLPQGIKYSRNEIMTGKKRDSFLDRLTPNQMPLEVAKGATKQSVNLPKDTTRSTTRPILKPGEIPPKKTTEDEFKFKQGLTRGSAKYVKPKKPKTPEDDWADQSYSSKVIPFLKKHVMPTAVAASLALEGIVSVISGTPSHLTNFSSLQSADLDRTYRFNSDQKTLTLDADFEDEKLMTNTYTIEGFQNKHFGEEQLKIVAVDGKTGNRMPYDVSHTSRKNTTKFNSEITLDTISVSHKNRTQTLARDAKGVITVVGESSPYDLVQEKNYALLFNEAHTFASHTLMNAILENTLDEAVNVNDQEAVNKVKLAQACYLDFTFNKPTLAQLKENHPQEGYDIVILTAGEISQTHQRQARQLAKITETLDSAKQFSFKQTFSRISSALAGYANDVRAIASNIVSYEAPVLVAKNEVDTTVAKVTPLVKENPVKNPEITPVVAKAPVASKPIDLDVLVNETLPGSAIGLAFSEIVSTYAAQPQMQETQTAIRATRNEVRRAIYEVAGGHKEKFTPKAYEIAISLGIGEGGLTPLKFLTDKPNAQMKFDASYAQFEQVASLLGRDLTPLRVPKETLLTKYKPTIPIGSVAQPTEQQVATAQKIYAFDVGGMPLIIDAGADNRASVQETINAAYFNFGPKKNTNNVAFDALEDVLNTDSVGVAQFIGSSEKKDRDRDVTDELDTIIASTKGADKLNYELNTQTGEKSFDLAYETETAKILTLGKLVTKYGRDNVSVEGVDLDKLMDSYATLNKVSPKKASPRKEIVRKPDSYNTPSLPKYEPVVAGENNLLPKLVKTPGSAETKYTQDNETSHKPLKGAKRVNGGTIVKHGNSTEMFPQRGPSPVDIVANDNDSLKAVPVDENTLYTINQLENGYSAITRGGKIDYSDNGSVLDAYESDVAERERISSVAKNLGIAPGSIGRGGLPLVPNADQHFAIAHRDNANAGETREKLVGAYKAITNNRKSDSWIAKKEGTFDYNKNILDENPYDGKVTEHEMDLDKLISFTDEIIVKQLGEFNRDEMTKQEISDYLGNRDEYIANNFHIHDAPTPIQKYTDLHAYVTSRLRDDTAPSEMVQGNELHFPTGDMMYKSPISPPIDLTSNYKPGMQVADPEGYPELVIPPPPPKDVTVK